MFNQSAADESECVCTGHSGQICYGATAAERSRWKLLNTLNYFEIAQTVSGSIQRG